jgi:hypothetical protein
MTSIAERFVHVRLHTPDLTEELVRFLRHMGLAAREVDYGVVEVVIDGLDADQLRDYLRIWQGVHVRAAVELDAA